MSNIPEILKKYRKHEWKKCVYVVFNWTTFWENLFMPYANNKGADQLAHLRSLIGTFVVHCLDSIIPLVSICKSGPYHTGAVWCGSALYD